ncbi:MAG: dihydrofolate reductase [Oscillospiraceae bacterium]|nr:dihydrofolate reductase [Oscillospiraceae bacterium]
MTAIAAVSRNWGIGNDNDLLYNIPEDKRFFRRTTLGHTVIMGRKTLLSLPGGKPFKDRNNIVLSGNRNFSCEGAVVVGSISEAVEYAEGAEGEVFIVGGGSVYKEMLPFCDKALITKIDGEPDADVFFPNLDKLPEWRIEKESEDYDFEGVRYKFCTYVRVDSAT